MIARVLLIFCTLLGCYSAHAQAVLFSEDFEAGLGQFQAVSGRAGLGWFWGPAAGNGPYRGGQQAAYASTSAATYAPIPNVADATHLYCDVTFPANTGVFYLRFDARTEGILRIFSGAAALVPVPVVGVVPTGVPEYTRVGNVSRFTPFQYTLNPNVAGTTQRFIFTWTNQAGRNELPAALDNVQFMAGPMPPLAGAYTIDQLQPNSARSFNSFTEAIWALNTGGTAGPTTFEVTPGQRFAEAVPPLRGTNSHAVVFRRGAGAGANPALQGAGFYIWGASYLTFDGIDIVPDANGPTLGYWLSNRDNVAGCRWVTIRNCTIRLGNSLAPPSSTSATSATKGIYQQSGLYANQGASDSTRVNGHIRYENIQIEHADQGIWLKSDHDNMPDYDVEISHVTIGSGATRNIGRPGYIEGTNGIYGFRINGLRVHDCVIQGLVGGNDQLCGIYLYDAAGPRPTIIAGNRIENLEYVLPTYSPTSYTSIYGVQLWQSSLHIQTPYPTPAADIRVFNNQVQNLYYSAAPTYSRPIEGGATGLYFMVENAAANAFLVANNTVALDNTATPGVGLLGLSFNCTQPTHGPVESLNNILVATTPASGRLSASLFSVGIPRGQTPATTTNLHLDHNDFVLNSAAQGNAGSMYTEGYATSPSLLYVGHTLADWQALTKQEIHSRDLDPQFAPGSDLRPTNAALGRTGTPLPLLLTDLAGVIRLSPPDMGALEFSKAPLHSPSDKLLAWPVPFADELTLELPATLPGELRAELIDAMGRVVFTQTLPDAGPTRRLTGLGQLVPGSYVLRLRAASGEILRLHLAK